MRPLRVLVVSSGDFETYRTGGTLSFLRAVLPRMSSDIVLAGMRRTGTPPLAPTLRFENREVPRVDMGEVDDASYVPARVQARRRCLAARGRLAEASQGLDVAYVHAAELVAPVARASGLPVVYHMHGSSTSTLYSRHRLLRSATGTRILTAVSDRAVRVASAVFGVDANCAAYAANLGAPFVLVPTCFDPAAIPERSEGAASDEYRVAFVGKIEPVKNVPRIIEAFASLLERRPAGSLHIAGDGSERGASERRADELGVSDRVVFLGEIDRAGVYSLLSRSTVFCLASEFEGMPISLLEAMAAGCVPCLPRFEGTAGTVDDGVNGVVFDALTPDAIASALDVSVSLAKEGAGVLARESVVSRYSAEVVARRIDEALRHVIDYAAAMENGS